MCDDYINEHSNESVDELKEHLKELIVGKKRNRNTIISAIEKFIDTKDKTGTIAAYKHLITDISIYDENATLDGIDFRG